MISFQVHSQVVEVVGVVLHVERKILLESLLDSSVSGEFVILSKLGGHVISRATKP